MDFTGILTTILHNTFVYSTPLLFAALGGAYSERSGVVNIGLEGLMMIGAFMSAVSTIYLGETLGLGGIAPWLGLLLAMAVGVIFSLPHAVASITFKADQVVSGVALNFLAGGFAVFMLKKIFDGAAQSSTIQNKLVKINFLGLGDIPFLGRGIFTSYPTTYLALLAVLVTYLIFYKTSFGLRLRAVGEHPHAADTMGINVIRMRYIAVMISGGLAALGGATISLSITSNYTNSTVSGQGFMALAALIFGKWHPLGAMGAALFFGMAQALAAVGQVLGLTKYVPADFLTALPYILTILALAGLVWRADAPKAIGKPYEKGSR